MVSFENILRAMRQTMFISPDGSNASILIERTQDFLNALLSAQGDGPVYPRCERKLSVEEIIEEAELPLKGESILNILQTLSRNLEGSIKANHPFMVKNIIAPPSIYHLACNSVVSLLMANGVSGEYSGNILDAEVSCVSAISKLAGYDHHKSAGLFTFGGTGTNLYAFRVALIKVNMINLTEKGSDSVIVGSLPAHYCHRIACEWLGIGDKNYIAVKSYQDQSTNINDLEKVCSRLIEQGKKIACIVGVGGTTSNMAIDDFEALSKLVDKLVTRFDLNYRPHVHADSVVGWAYLNFLDYEFKTNPLGFSPQVICKLKEVTKSVATLKYADSFGVDFHKTGFMPYVSSVIIFRDKDNISLLSRDKSTMTPLFHDGTAYNPGIFTLETSRSSANILASWITLKSIGIEGYRVLLGHALEISQTIRNFINNNQERSIVIVNKVSYGSDVFIRCYPNDLSDGENLFSQELNNDKLLKENNDYNDQFYKWLLKFNTLAYKATTFSKTSAAFYTESGQPVVAFRIYLLNPYATHETSVQLIKHFYSLKHEYEGSLDQTVLNQLNVSEEKNDSSDIIKTTSMPMHSYAATKNMTKLNEFDAIYLDEDIYAREGFTSGRLIIIRQMLEKLTKVGKTSAIVSITNKNFSTHWKDSDKVGLQFRIDQGISVFEYLVGKNLIDLEIIVLQDIISALIMKCKPKLIIMNTPAVFIHSTDVLFRKLAEESHNVIHILVDELFPTLEKHPDKQSLVTELYSIIGKGKVMTMSKQIQQSFEDNTGIKPQLFQNTFNMETILIDDTELSESKDERKADSNLSSSNSIERTTILDGSTGRLEKYITLINTHPIKGRVIFNEIARLLPHRKFLIVETRKDVPFYAPKYSNIKFEKFTEKPKHIYKITTILLIPSLMKEGVARVAFEAMVNGIPVIANRIGSLPELGEQNVVFINPPKINDYVMDGSVMLPIIDEEEIKETAKNYATIIETIYEQPPLLQIERAKAFAWKYIYDAEMTLNHMLLNSIFKKDFFQSGSFSTYTANDILSMHASDVPAVIKEVRLDFKIDHNKLWSLSLPIEKRKIGDLIWALNVPFWPHDGQLFQLSARQTMIFPQLYPEEYAKIVNADMQFPIDIIYYKQRWLVLDGLHRLSKGFINNEAEVLVRILPPYLIRFIVNYDLTFASMDISSWIENNLKHLYPVVSN